ncbi:MAG: uroporphyrinogen-III C-methyltransferase [Gammaproteobacteria bacterium]|nr:uroporphyrinogen-III C-methyltransferase [Gammaproteobacteria bacterium]
MSLTIWVTRPNPEGEAWCKVIQKTGARAISIPTIEITPTPKREELKHAIAQLATTDLAIFVSKHAVQAVASLLVKAPAALKWFAIGEATAEALKACGISEFSYPKKETHSEALLDLPELQQIQGKKILIFRGSEGREWLKKILRERGGIVEYVETYVRKVPTLSHQEITRMWSCHTPDAIFTTSGELLKNLYHLTPTNLRKSLQKIPLVVISQRMQTIACEWGFQNVVCSEQIEPLACLSALQKWYGRNGLGKLEMNKGIAWIGFLLFLSFMLGGAAIGLSYYQTTRLNQALITKTHPLLEYQSTAQTELATLKEKTRALDEQQGALRNRIDVLEGEPSFFSLVPPKQRLVWQLGEAAYLSRIAHRKLFYEQDFKTAELLLAELDALLLNTKEPDLYFIHQEVENKLQEVKKFKEEIPEVIPLLNSLIQYIEQLPEQSFQSHILLPAPSPRSEQPEDDLPQWRRLLASWWKQIKASIQIRKMDEKIIASPSFELAVYTLVNRVEQAKLAFLRRDDLAYQAELTRCEEWLRTYFQEKTPPVAAVLEQLQKLNGWVMPAVPDLSPLTALLATAILNQQKAL